MKDTFVIYQTQWTPRDKDKQYPNGAGFEAPLLIAPSNVDFDELTEKCKMLSTDEWECTCAIPRQLIDLGYNTDSNEYTIQPPEHYIPNIEMVAVTRFPKPVDKPLFDISVTLVNDTDESRHVTLFSVDAESDSSFINNSGVKVERCHWLNNKTQQVSEDYHALLDYLRDKVVSIDYTTLISQNYRSPFLQHTIELVLGIDCLQQSNINIIPYMGPNQYEAYSDIGYVLANESGERTVVKVIVPPNETVHICLTTKK